MKPDLLPRKLTPQALFQSPPDLIKTNELDFIKNAAKREFLLKGSSVSSSNSSSEALNRRRSSDVIKTDRVSSLLTDKRRHVDVVKRGLSMTNLAETLSENSPSSLFTRTTSHISLCPSAKDSSANESRPPSRTVSQITLTLKKLSLSGSNSASEDFSSKNPTPTPQLKKTEEGRR